MTEPTTEAGKRLVSKADALNARSFAIVTIDDAIAIEAEARAAVLRELRGEFANANLGATWLLRKAVLAAIDRRLGNG
jgi:hypothetical protein